MWKIPISAQPSTRVQNASAGRPEKRLPSWTRPQPPVLRSRLLPRVQEQRSMLQGATEAEHGPVSLCHLSWHHLRPPWGGGREVMMTASVGTQHCSPVQVHRDLIAPQSTSKARTPGNPPDKSCCAEGQKPPGQPGGSGQPAQPHKARPHKAWPPGPLLPPRPASLRCPGLFGEQEPCHVL